MNPQDRQKVLVAAAAAIVGLYFLDAVVFSPLGKVWKARGEENVKLESSIRQGKSLLEREAGINRKWSEMKANSLPAETSEAEQQILGAIEKWSGSAGIRVTSLKPQWKRGDRDDHTVFECRVDASGSMSALAKFLYEIEVSPAAVRVQSLGLTARDNNGEQMSLALVISGLRFGRGEVR
jgi:hypothetical protein